jgi:hypothetical protein
MGRSLEDAGEDADVAGSHLRGRCIYCAGPLAGIVYNLPLLQAYDVLAQALRALRDQGEFSCKGHFLGQLVEASKTSIPWLDWKTIRDGVDLRNAVAHDGALHETPVCLNAIAAVEEQLSSWGIIPSA